MTSTRTPDHDQLRQEIASRRRTVLSDARRGQALAEYRRLQGIPRTKVMDHLALHACFLMRAEAALCALRGPDGLEWHGQAHCTPPGPGLALDRTLVDWAVIRGAPLMFDDTTGFPEEFADVAHLGWRSVAAMPLLVRGVAVGALLVGRSGGVPWGVREREALRHWMAMHAIMNERCAPRALDPSTRRIAELEELDTIFARAPLAMAVIDADGCCQRVNPAFCALAGRAAEEILGTHIRTFVQPFAGDPTAGYLEDMLAGRRRGYVAERRLVRPDGRERRVRITATQIRYERDGRHVQFAVVEDITDRPDAERALREREQQLHLAQRREALGQLAGGIAHDFSNTLAAITGFASLLRDDLDPDDPRREDAEDILRVTERATELTRRLLDLSAHRVAERATFDLREVLRAFASVARRVLPTTIEWRLDVPPDEVLAMIDRARVEQALLGLVVNARDAMPQGGEIQVSLSATMREGEEGVLEPVARIAVTDTGSGITEEVAERLWTPFFSTKPGGTGLGLSIGLAILREHGGDLRLESPPGVSATFAAYLPRLTRTPVGGTPIAPPGRPLRGAPTGRLVLLVEDERTVRATTTRVLERAGYRVLAAEDGEEAWRLFQAHADEIDALVTDLQMPRLSGAELIRRARQRRPDLPVVVASAHPSEGTDDRELRSAVTASLRKPFPATALVDTLRTLVPRVG